MTEDEALDVAATAKEVFPFTTDMQAVAVRDMARKMPDWVREDASDPSPARFLDQTLRTMATHEERISLPKIRSIIECELRRRGLTNEDRGRREERKKEAVVYASWQKIDEMIAQLSDEDLADLKPNALMYLTNQKARDMLSEKSPRDSKTLRWLIYRLLTERSAA